MVCPEHEFVKTRPLLAEFNEKFARSNFLQMEDTDTGRVVDESVESASSEGESQSRGFEAEDTLENVEDVKK
uniref:Uncharacterized protein n=1 Tax=Parascaris equorum TaxID=6256 RepID=A0A914RDN6_PAREQ